MVGDEIGAPGMNRTAVAEVAVGNGRGPGAGSLSGDYVAPVVANVERALRDAAENLAGVQDG